MKIYPFWLRNILMLLAVICFLAPALAQQKFEYPKTRKSDHVDTYHGVKVSDPYRWLEEDSRETQKWIGDQAAYTDRYLEAIPFREVFENRLAQIQNFQRFSDVRKVGDYLIWFENDGQQAQDVLYIQRGKNAKTEVLLDPNKFSEEGTDYLRRMPSDFQRNRHRRCT